MTSMSRGDSTVCIYVAVPDMATPDHFFISVLHSTAINTGGNYNSEEGTDELLHSTTWYPYLP
eukprot:8106072-Ditylum_brightwellii.AAC.1